MDWKPLIEVAPPVVVLTEIAPRAEVKWDATSAMIAALTEFMSVLIAAETEAISVLITADTEASLAMAATEAACAAALAVCTDTSLTDTSFEI
jgi:hypothetical protein